MNLLSHNGMLLSVLAMSIPSHPYYSISVFRKIQTSVPFVVFFVIDLYGSKHYKDRQWGEGEDGRRTWQRQQQQRSLCSVELKIWKSWKRIWEVRKTAHRVQSMNSARFQKYIIYLYPVCVLCTTKIPLLKNMHLCYFVLELETVFGKWGTGTWYTMGPFEGEAGWLDVMKWIAKKQVTGICKLQLVTIVYILTKLKSCWWDTI